MTQTRRILRDTAAWAILIAIGGGVIGGLGFGAQVALVAAATVGNLALFTHASSRFLTSLAAGEGGGLWGAFLSGKIVLTASIVALALVLLSPEAVAVGMSAMFFGVATTGITLAIRPPEWPEHLAMESR
ncbi:MAG: hypothetical protein ACI8PZ_000141 [Myxococcota bacterium]|jgi:hypothetical protein